jgi:tight adherence protein B
VPVAIFLCILFLLEGLFLVLHDSRGKSEKRIKARLKFIQGLESGEATGSLIKSELLSQDSWKKMWLGKISRLFNLDELLLQADVPWKSTRSSW